MKAIRFFLGLLIVGAGVLAVSFLQKKFDEGDIRKAMTALRLKSPELVNRVPCEAEIVSRVRGEVRIRCGEKGFRIDLLRGVIEPETQPR